MMITDYVTHDLALAAFLVASGHPLLGIEPAGGRRKVFRFPPDAAALAPSFFANASIPARAYANAIRDLKAAVYAPTPARGDYDHERRPTAAR